MFAVTMSSVQSLREFINERLTAAAEEIFTQFEKTIIHYEEEVDRQRRLLDFSWKPQINLHKIELPQHYVLKEEELLIDQQLCNPEEAECPQIKENPNKSEETEGSQVKEEQQKFGVSRDEKQFVLKLETDTFMAIPVEEEREHNEPEPNGNQLLSQNSTEAESQNQEQDRIEDTVSNKEEQLKNKCLQTRNPRNNIQNPKIKKHFSCQTCGKSFSVKTSFTRHMRTHTGEKPFSCQICGKGFGLRGHLRYHIRIHTGEKPFSCQICGKSFTHRGNLVYHMKTHTGEKPFSCQTCGKSFGRRCNLIDHMRTHTGEKPFTCQTCSKCFSRRYTLLKHMGTHTFENV